MLSRKEAWDGLADGSITVASARGEALHRALRH